MFAWLIVRYPDDDPVLSNSDTRSTPIVTHTRREADGLGTNELLEWMRKTCRQVIAPGYPQDEEDDEEEDESELMTCDRFPVRLWACLSRTTGRDNAYPNAESVFLADEVQWKELQRLRWRDACGGVDSSRPRIFQKVKRPIWKRLKHRGSFIGFYAENPNV